MNMVRDWRGNVPALGTVRSFWVNTLRHSWPFERAVQFFGPHSSGICMGFTKTLPAINVFWLVKPHNGSGALSIIWWFKKMSTLGLVHFTEAMNSILCRYTWGATNTADQKRNQKSNRVGYVGAGWLELVLVDNLDTLCRVKVVGLFSDWRGEVHGVELSSERPDNFRILKHRDHFQNYWLVDSHVAYFLSLLFSIAFCNCWYRTGSTFVWLESRSSFNSYESAKFGNPSRVRLWEKMVFAWNILVALDGQHLAIRCRPLHALLRLVLHVPRRTGRFGTYAYC